MHIPCDPKANGVNREYYRDGILIREINNPKDLQFRDIVDKVYANVVADIRGVRRPYVLDENLNYINAKDAWKL